MSHRPDNKTRKDLLRRVKRDAQNRAREALPLPDDLMRAMFDMLDSAIPERGCDHSLRFVREWAAGQGFPIDAIEAWCRNNNGFCDCEVLANAEEAFLFAIRET